MAINFDYLTGKEYDEIVEKLSDVMIKKIEIEYLDKNKMRAKIQAALYGMKTPIFESDTVTIKLKTDLVADYYFFSEIINEMRNKKFCQAKKHE